MDDLDSDRLIAASKAFARVASQRETLSADASISEWAAVEESISVAFDQFRKECDEVFAEGKRVAALRRLSRLFIEFDVSAVLAVAVDRSNPNAAKESINVMNDLRLVVGSAS